MNPYVPILATVFLLGPGTAHAQDAPDKAAAPKSTLRLKYTEGTTHYHSMTVSTDMTMALPNGEMKLKMGQEMQIETKVLGVKDGIATMGQKILRVRINSDSPMAKIDYDSDRDEEPPRSLEMLTDLVGAEFEYKTDDRGKLVEFKPPDSLEMDALDKIGFDIKGMFERTPVVLPEGPVGVGDTWESDGSMAMGPMGRFKLKTTYTLTKLAGGKAWLASTVAFEMDGKGGLGGKLLSCEDAKGTFVLDLNKGIIEDMGSSMSMKMDMANEESPAKMEMEMVAETRMRLTEPPTPKAPKQDATKPAPEPAPVKQERK